MFVYYLIKGTFLVIMKWNKKHLLHSLCLTWWGKKIWFVSEHSGIWLIIQSIELYIIIKLLQSCWDPMALKIPNPNIYFIFKHLCLNKQCYALKNYNRFILASHKCIIKQKKKQTNKKEKKSGMNTSIKISHLKNNVPSWACVSGL